VFAVTGSSQLSAEPGGRDLSSGHQQGQGDGVNDHVITPDHILPTHKELGPGSTGRHGWLIGGKGDHHIEVRCYAGLQCGYTR
jgi:hypothetical protein